MINNIQNSIFYKPLQQQSKLSFSSQHSSYKGKENLSKKKNILLLSGIGVLSFLLLKYNPALSTQLKKIGFDLVASPKFKPVLDPLSSFFDNSWVVNPSSKRYFKEFAPIVPDKLYRGIRPISMPYQKVFLKNTSYNAENEIKFFQKLKDHGIKTIIDFTRANTVLRTKEATMANQFGMNYFNLPLSALRPPSQEEIVQFAKTIKGAKGAVYIHCLDGKDRTGVMSAIYSVIKDQLSFEEAFKTMKQFKHSDNKFPKLQEFLRAFVESGEYKGLREHLSEILS